MEKTFTFGTYRQNQLVLPLVELDLSKFPRIGLIVKGRRWL